MKEQRAADRRILPRILILWLAANFLLVVFVLLTSAAEETMFRGLIQTQVGEGYGVWAGLLLALLLFGLAHRYGRSTCAPAVMHILLLVMARLVGKVDE